MDKKVTYKYMYVCITTINIFIYLKMSTFPKKKLRKMNEPDVLEKRK